MEDVEKILESFEGWEKWYPKTSSMKKLKRQETVHARDYFFTNVKKTGNPLFKVNKLSIKEQVDNLGFFW